MAILPMVAIAQSDHVQDPSPSAFSTTIVVHLELVTGGQLDGSVVDHDEHGLVIVHDRTPYVFAWSELEPASAVTVKRQLLVFKRGGSDRLLPEDRLTLGQYALDRGRNDLAVMEFKPLRASHDFGPQIEQAFRDFRVQQEQLKDHHTPSPLANITPTTNEAPPTKPGATLHPSSETPRWSDFKVVEGSSTETRQKIRDAYLTFGREVQKVIGKRTTRIETDHFLIWTDWSPHNHALLADLCESMYAALSRQFMLNPTDNIFIGKCPIFCWRSKGRFLKFARHFDGYLGHESTGYTRSVEANGHVHLVLLRQGRQPDDFDRFACTMVHEGTHAFLHRLFSTQLIPSWVNEGYAELMAERVLSDRCPAGEKASLLAKQYAKYGWPVEPLLRTSAPIEVYQYALAHSVVAFLETMDPQKFSLFIRHLKQGESTEQALKLAYDGLSVPKLVDQWRRSIRTPDEKTTKAEASR